MAILAANAPVALPFLIFYLLTNPPSNLFLSIGNLLLNSQDSALIEALQDGPPLAVRNWLHQNPLN